MTAVITSIGVCLKTLSQVLRHTRSMEQTLQQLFREETEHLSQGAQGTPGDDAAEQNILPPRACERRVKDALEGQYRHQNLRRCIQQGLLRPDSALDLLLEHRHLQEAQLEVGVG